MRKIFMSILGILGVVALFFTGCTAKQLPVLDGRLLPYDLGESVVQTFDNRSVPYRIQGVLGIPDEENAPIVVIIHGSHPINNAAKDRYDIGFNYLAQGLSEQGNLVISMNVGINYSFEDGEPLGNERTKQIITEQLSLLRRAVEGDDDLFGYDLSARGDFGKIVLMGHSRGGLDVLEWAAEAPADMQIAGIVCVAPSMYKVLETAFPNLPIGIIIPQMDGDVISLDGSDIYEDLIADAAYRQTAELVYLKRANHAFFNTQLTEPDLNHDETDLAKLISPEKQREFLTDYLADFVRSATERGESVFTFAPELKSTAYGCDVLLRVHSGTANRLYRSGDCAPPVGGGDTAVDKKIASYLPDQNTIDTFRLPGSSSLGHYALEQISWPGERGEATLALTADLSGARFVDLDMAVDSTDLRNQSGQTMTLRFFDAAGNAAEVHVDQTAAALLWQEGELLSVRGWDDQMHFEYSTFTPLVTLRIGVDSLEGLNLEKITGLTLTWRSAQGGSVMLRSVSGIE